MIGKVFWAGAVAAMGERDAGERHLDPARALPQGARAPATAVVDGGGGRVRLLARPRPRRRLQPAPPGVPGQPACGSSQVDRVEGPRTSRRPGRRARLPLRDRPRARPRRRRERAGRQSSRHLRFASSGSPGNAPSASTPPPPSRASSGRSPSRRRATRNGPRRSPASARPPSTPDATWRRRTRSRRRSAPSRRRATFARPPGRWARSPTCCTSSRIQPGRNSPRRPSHSSSRCQPGPELVSALTELARADVLQGRSEAGLGYAEQALALAGELGLPRPARALGFRAMARVNLGDRGGLDDFREAIALATEAGQGREVALLHNNLCSGTLAVRGPRCGPGASCEPVSPSHRLADLPRWPA